jgi:hypothetical protein
MGSVLRSTICHYCGGKATTEDHIVPRAILPKPLSLLPYWFRGNNVVPACWDCNIVLKGAERSDCECDECTWAWNTALALFVNPNTRPRRIVVLVGDRERDLLA